jgi:hypothetical protein
MARNSLNASAGTATMSFDLTSKSFPKASNYTPYTQGDDDELCTSGFLLQKLSKQGFGTTNLEYVKLHLYKNRRDAYARLSTQNSPHERGMSSGLWKIGDN